jgi:hypothetical protein
MSEKDIIFNSSVKLKEGIFDFKEYYKFCYDWLAEETELLLSESKYNEKLVGDGKNIDIEWNGFRKLTDYFKFDAKVKFKIIQLKKVEINQDGRKIKMNHGEVKLSIKGTLVRDWQGKFETNAFKKFLRSVYEKYIIESRIDQFEEKIITDCDEFLNQAKAYLDLEGKR